MRNASRPMVLAALCSSAAASCHIPGPDMFDPLPIYRTVVGQLQTWDPHFGVILLDVRPWTLPSPDNFSAVDADYRLVRAYLWANASGGRVDPSQASALGLPIIDMESRFTSPDSTWVDPYETWLALGEEYGAPVLVVSFSRPGFDRSGNVAILHYEYACGTLCGGAAVARLERVGDEWRIVADFQYAVS